MKNPLKTALKNSYLFEENLLKKAGFAASLLRLMEKWNPSLEKDDSVDYRWYISKDLKKLKQQCAIVERKRTIFLKKLGGINTSEFYDDIVDFLIESDFGAEWFRSIQDLIIFGWLCPPEFNFHIAKRKGTTKRVVLILNPDTTLEDIKEAWPIIKKQQEELHPKFKRSYLAKKSFTNLYIGRDDIEERLLKVCKGSAYNDDKAENTAYNIKDIEIAGRIWEEEDNISELADKKRATNLRQIRHRFRLKKEGNLKT